MPLSIYLAGPGVFRPDAADHGAALKLLCADRGMIGLWPLDNDVSRVATRFDIATEIYRANCAMIDRADAVIADLAPFRGPHMDVGTAFEIGYAIAKGKPVFGYGAPGPMIDRIRSRDVAGKYRDDDGMSVEDFDLVENLMIAVPLAGVCSDAEGAIAAAAAGVNRG